MGVPMSSRAGPRTKRNGTMYTRMPMRMALYPVRIGSAPARAPAAKAARATGGVMAESMPQYIMYKCAARTGNTELY